MDSHQGPVVEEEVSSRNTGSSSTPNKSTRMSEPPPPPPINTHPALDLSSIHGSDYSQSNVSLLTDESAEGIPLNDALIHSTLGSMLEESNPMETSITSFAQHEAELARTEPPGEREVRQESPNPVNVVEKDSSSPMMDVTIPHPPESDDDDDWLARSVKKAPQVAESLIPSKDISRVQDFDDFNHPNVDFDRREEVVPQREDSFISSEIETKKSSTTKSSDEDDYEVIPAQHDVHHQDNNSDHEVSNLLSLSSHSEAGNTTVLESSKSDSLQRPEEEGSPAPSSPSPVVVLRDNEIESSPLFESTTTTAAAVVKEEVTQQKKQEESLLLNFSPASVVEEKEKEATAPSSFSTTTLSSEEQFLDSSSFPSAPRDVSHPHKTKEDTKQTSSPSSEHQPDSSSDPLSGFQLEKNKNPLPEESGNKISGIKQHSQQQSIMASEEASSTTGCPYTAGKISLSIFSHYTSLFVWFPGSLLLQVCRYFGYCLLMFCRLLPFIP
jgi:hypothetical protein